MNRSTISDAQKRFLKKLFGSNITWGTNLIEKKGKTLILKNLINANDFGDARESHYSSNLETEGDFVRNYAAKYIENKTEDQ